MDQDERLRLRAKAQQLDAVMSIGKSGITDGVVEEVARQLEEHRLLKVRVLPSAREEVTTQQLAEDLAQRTGGELVEVRGHTVVLWKGKKAKKRTPSAP